MAPGTCPGDNFRGTSNNLCTLNLLRLAACTSMYLSLWHSETWGGATHVHESDIWCGFSSTGSSNHNPWHFNYLAQATPDKTTLSLPNLDRLESTPAMPTSVHSNNRIITVHLTPMSGSIYFEAKALRFRLGQTMILGFETLGSNATAENGLFCAWTVHEEHARLLCDATDGVRSISLVGLKVLLSSQY